MGWFVGACDIGFVEGCIDKVYEDGSNNKASNSEKLVENMNRSLPCLLVVQRVAMSVR